MMYNSLNHTIMKFLSILSLFVFSMFFFGCATTSETDAAEEVAAEEAAEAKPAKTAYEGSTGSGLLMERYKSGQIEGFRE